jgi:hypothetical protein
MGCVDTPQDEDVIADMCWGVCSESGVVQLIKQVPNQLLYLTQFNEGVGTTWENLYREIANVLIEFECGPSVLEIGGAHDKIARAYLDNTKGTEWTDVEVNPQQVKDPRVKIVRSWFDLNTRFTSRFQTVVHSHVLEHSSSPYEFLASVNSVLQEGEWHVCAVPDILSWLERKFGNSLNFQHPYLLSQDVSEYLLTQTGFEIVDKRIYGDRHSVIYVTRKVGLPRDAADRDFFPSRREEYTSTFLDFVGYYQAVAHELNERRSQSPRPTYLFGAHIFSQYLLHFGLQEKGIVSILDNSSLKQGKRLYGTSLKVESPKVLKDAGEVNLILKAGPYTDEIKKQIVETINGQVSFWL